MHSMIESDAKRVQVSTDPPEIVEIELDDNFVTRAGAVDWTKFIGAKNIQIDDSKNYKLIAKSIDSLTHLSDNVAFDFYSVEIVECVNLINLSLGAPAMGKQKNKLRAIEIVGCPKLNFKPNTDFYKNVETLKIDCYRITYGKDTTEKVIDYSVKNNTNIDLSALRNLKKLHLTNTAYHYSKTRLAIRNEEKQSIHLENVLIMYDRGDVNKIFHNTSKLKTLRFNKCDKLYGLDASGMDSLKTLELTGCDKVLRVNLKEDVEYKSITFCQNQSLTQFFGGRHAEKIIVYECPGMLNYPVDWMAKFFYIEFRNGNEFSDKVGLMSGYPEKIEPPLNVPPVNVKSKENALSSKLRLSDPNLNDLVIKDSPNLTNVEITDPSVVESMYIENCPKLVIENVSLPEDVNNYVFRAVDCAGLGQSITIYRALLFKEFEYVESELRQIDGNPTIVYHHVVKVS